MTHPFEKYLAPIKQGVLFAQRFTLKSIQEEEIPVLVFQDHEENETVRIRVFATKSNVKSFASDGPVSVSFPETTRIYPKAELLARAVARIVANNLKNLSEQEILNLLEISTDDTLLIVDPDKRIDLPIGHACPSNCIFCTDTCRQELYTRRSKQSCLQAMELAREQGYEGLTFNGLEPTLRPDFPDLVEAASKMGFQDVEVITNGSRIADRAFLELLFEKGMRVIVLSIHGPDNETERKITRREHLFEKKLQALKNLKTILGDVKQQRSIGRFWRSNTVLTTYNIPVLPQLFDLLHYHTPHQITLNYPWMNGQAAINAEQVAAPFSDVRDALLNIIARSPGNRMPFAINSGLPLCVLPEIVYSGPESINVVSTEEIITSGKSDKSTPIIQNLGREPEFIHPDVCSTCLLQSQCPGVSSRYVEIHGTLGIQPFDEAGVQQRASQMKRYKIG